MQISSGIAAVLASPVRRLRQEAFNGVLEIDWHQSLFDYHKQNRNWFNQKTVKTAAAEEHEAYRNWQVNQPIFDGRNKWRQTYSETDMSRLYEGKGGEHMKAWNYI